MKLKIKTWYHFHVNKGSIWHLILPRPGFDSLVMSGHHSSQWSLRGEPPCWYTRRINVLKPSLDLSSLIHVKAKEYKTRLLLQKWFHPNALKWGTYFLTEQEAQLTAFASFKIHCSRRKLSVSFTDLKKNHLQEKDEKVNSLEKKVKRKLEIILCFENCCNLQWEKKVFANYWPFDLDH